MKKLTAVILVLSLLLCGCGTSPDGVESLMEEVPARVVCLAENPDRSGEAANFALRLLHSSVKEGENTLISPLSVLVALAMTTNGADGETLTQMEEVLGMTTSDMNAYLYSFMDGQEDALKLANSIWFKDSRSLAIEDTFLDTNANFYMADLFKAPMDIGTLTEINNWVAEKTDGTIPKILGEMPENTVMVLLNALAFEAQWESVYEEHQVRKGTFTTEDGREQTVEFMSSAEYAYLEDENATGFIKFYDGRKYAFAALLPREGVSVSDYVADLTGEHLQEMLKNPENIITYVDIPKFETEYSVELSGSLAAMGMADAFDPDLADFSRMGSSENGNLYISQVLHKTFISVAEQGTKAGAATAVLIAEGAAEIVEYKTVNLDRPFVYMLIDCEENLPFFIGTMMDVG